MRAIFAFKNTLFIRERLNRLVLYMGVFATAIFDIRNWGKVQNGDTGRCAAAAAQTTNLINAAAKSDISILNTGANAILNNVDKAGKAFGITNTAKKVTGFASKAVNPLLCVASGIRVLKDDDQYAALIEEGSAMGAMFLAEGMYKKIISNPAAGKEIASKSKIIQNISGKVQKMTSGLTGWKKIAAMAALDVGLVGASILSFDIGKKIGKKLSHRENNAQNMPILAQDNINQSTNGVIYNS